MYIEWWLLILIIFISNYFVWRITYMYCHVKLMKILDKLLEDMKAEAAKKLSIRMEELEKELERRNHENS